MFFQELIGRVRYWSTVDRVGPDIPLTHWRLHFKSTMRKLCRKKFLRFGLDAEFRPGAYAICCSKISVGDRVVVRPGCMFFADGREGGAGITIEDDVMLGAGVHIYVHNHAFDNSSRPIIDQGYSPSAAVVLASGCWVGARVIILSGVSIGRNSVVAAGAVVTRSVPDFSVVAGNPARIVRQIGAQ